MATRVIPHRDKKAANYTWHFYQEGFEDPIPGYSYENLIANVLKFRIDNDLDVGDPEADVATYTRDSKLGPARELPEPDRRRENQRSLMDQIRLWSKLAKNKPLPLETKEVAEARASVCETCEQNRAIAQITQCAPCVAALDRTAVILTGNKTTGRKIGACVAAMQDSRVAVWLPKEGLARSLERVESTIPECWLRDL